MRRASKLAGQRLRHIQRCFEHICIVFPLGISLKRHNFHRLLGHYDPPISWTTRGEFPQSGTYHCKLHIIVGKGLAILSSLRAITIQHNPLYPFQVLKRISSVERSKRTSADVHSKEKELAQ
jgi:hypothetical protein